MAAPPSRPESTVRASTKGGASPERADGQERSGGKELLAVLEGLQEVLGARESRDSRTGDRLNAIAGFEFKQHLPVIKDSDCDFERHIREFQLILDCHSFGRRGIRPIDQLTVSGRRSRRAAFG